MIAEILAASVLVAFNVAIVVLGYISGGLLGVLVAVMFAAALNGIAYLFAQQL